MSRAEVFARIRAALGDERSTPTALQRPPRPSASRDPLQRFCERARYHACTVQPLPALSAVPQAVLDWLLLHKLPPAIALARPLAALAWPDTLRRNTAAAGQDTVTAVSLAAAGVAETGSLVMRSGPESPTTHNFAPEYQIVVLHATDIVAQQEQVWVQLRAQGPLPRAINFIAGPSRTGDVEQTIQLGAHGPRAVHVLLIEG